MLEPGQQVEAHADSAFSFSHGIRYPSIAASASAAPYADSAMTAHSAVIGSSSVFAAFVDFHLVISDRHLPPRTRPLLGRVRPGPAADGRAGPLRFRKESRFGQDSEGIGSGVTVPGTGKSSGRAQAGGPEAPDTQRKREGGRAWRGGESAEFEGRE